VDFIPEHYGLFDGPIPVNTCKAVVICFDRFNLETQQIEPFIIGNPEANMKNENKK
jgi:hypothetical protein